MAYSELIKNFNRIRDYMREFYVYGFKSREEYTGKSARSYDDERRRLESWLGNYIQFRQTPDGKNVYLSIDSRVSKHNPLYKAWKAKSFTDGDITLHFLLFDILHDPSVRLTISEIAKRLDEKLSGFTKPKTFDESTLRKKLKEYCSEGIITSEKSGRTVIYSRAEDAPLPGSDILDYFSEAVPCGVVGSFLLDKTGEHSGAFAFKHHYITGAMDSEVLFSLFSAMREKCGVILETVGRQKDRSFESRVIPLRVMMSVQSGRQYLMAYVPRFKRISSFRIDHIVSVKLGSAEESFDALRKKLNGMQKHMWGVSTQSDSGSRLEHVEFTVCYSDKERHIPKRLEREKRCGTVEQIDKNHCRFTADVFNISEMIPWIRTFICRITELSFSDKTLEEQFRNDLHELYIRYGLEGGDSV